MSTPLIDLYQVRVEYQQDGLTHSFQTWVIPFGFSTTPTGSMFDYQIDVQTGSLTAGAWVDELVDEIKVAFAETTTFVGAELYAYEQGSTDGIFLAAVGLDVDGTAAGTAVPAAQTIATARTLEGRIKKLYFEETVSAPTSPVTWNVAGGTGYDPIGDWIINGSGIAICDRAGGRVVALLKIFPGQNEATFKRRYRPY